MGRKVIDANLYWFPETLFSDEALAEQFLSEIPVQYGIRGSLRTNAKTGVRQYVIEKPVGSENLNYVEGDYVLERQLADMDKAGISQAVLKLSCQQEWMSLDMCRLFNDGMAAHVKASNGRMKALGVVPPQGSPAVFREIDRCLDELGFGGLQLSAHYGNLYLDDEAFAPFFAYLNERHITCYVHHTPVPVQYDSLTAYTNLRRSYGRCIDQATAIGRELFSGFFTRYPNVKLVHSMLGGGFFAYASLWFPKKPKVQEAVSRFKDDNEQIVEQLQNNIYFEMSHAQPWGREQLECAVRVLGADHILFGTSYPVRPVWLLEGADFVEQLDLSEAEKDLILGGNAERLYHL
ncbi:MAG: amidohydrolase [Clostridia bacterium]|nr:amidohydrolase [Clostridia bacterium]